MGISYRYDYSRWRYVRAGAGVQSEQREAQVNLTEATEDPIQVSEEPKASYAQEGKPRSMTYYFQHYATYCFYILVHLSLQELIEILVAWS